ncbi:hypothetical protein ACLK1T_24280 [Escherichia coli]
MFIGKIDGRQTCVDTRLSCYFAVCIIAGYAWCGCYGGDDGGDFHPRSASNVRWAGEPAIRWELL